MSSSHETLGDLTGLYALGALTPAEQAAFEEHLAECDICRAETAALGVAAGGLAHAVPQVEPPLELRDRVIRTARAGAAPAVIAPAPRTRAPSVRPLPWLAAASVVAAAALGVYSIQLRGRQADLEARLEQAIGEAALAQGEVAEARRAALEAQSQVAVLAAPDLVRVDLAGQAAPAARARALWSRSRGMIFTASDLPALQEGRVYQLWVIPAAASPISVGLLQPDQSGVVTALFQTAPDMPAPAAIAVSDEPAGGVPSPTGMIWVAGKPIA